MCGIAGFIDQNKLLNDVTIKSMSDSLSHRGPNDAGDYFNNNHHCSIGLGHRRLSIIDLSNHGHQPMYYDGLWMVYNGEIYNYKSIKQELIDSGYEFNSSSDTEVILKLYHKEGIGFLEKINGMYAIGVYSEKTDELLLIRDRAGVKPLYYSNKNGALIFGSEIKALHLSNAIDKELDGGAISNFFRYGYILGPESIFKNIKKLQPGSFLKYNTRNGSCSISQYWSPIKFYNEPRSNIVYEDALDHVEELLKDSCSLRMVSDVPVGVFLSGGYDSSLITALVQSSSTEKVNTFSIGFNESEFDESQHASNVAKHLGTNHHELICSASDAIALIEKIPLHWDEPFGDSSAIPTMLVSKFAKERVTVSLSADGGDEIFGGYNKYNQIKTLSNILNNRLFNKALVIASDAAAPISSLLNNNFPKFEKRVNKIRLALDDHSGPNLLSIAGSIFLPAELNAMLNGGFHSKNTVFTDKSLFQPNVEEMNKVLAIDYLTYQADDILTKIDRATMAFSLEGREPLLDYRIIEYVATLPFSFKLCGRSQKRMLKDIVHKYIPKSIMDRPKMGFGVPVNHWMKNELRDILEQNLSKERIDYYGILNYEYVEMLKNRYIGGEIDLADKVWLILIFQMWCSRWL
jgi:asparagine synthase (glutamine-hydrolysing)